MNSAAVTTRSAAAGEALNACPQCGAVFIRRRPHQEFCAAKCRSAYHADHGIEGTVNRLQRVKGGVSLAIRLEGPAAEAAIKLQLHERVRVVKL